MKVLVAALVAAVGIAASDAGAAMISLSPVEQTVGQGEPFTVDLNISGLGNGTALGAFDVSVNLDSAALTFQGATFGDPTLGDQLDLGNLGLNGPTATPGTGTVDLTETDIFDSPSALLADQVHSFTLAVLTFYAIGSGTKPLTATVNSLADQNGNPFGASTMTASVTVQSSPVPLPGSALLMTSGIVALVGCLFRSRAVRDNYMIA